MLLLRSQDIKADTILEKIIPSNLRSKAAAYDRRHFSSDAMTITTDEIKAMLIAQDMKCSLTGIPFQQIIGTRYFPYRASLDRIDNSQGHTKENSQIVLLAINLGKNTCDNEKLKAYVEAIQHSHGADFMGLKAIGV